MSQLGVAITDCERAIAQHDRASGLWGTLQGIALNIAKHRLPHGKFMPFVTEHMGKAHCQATRRMRLAQAFLDAAPKVCGRAHFEEVQRILGQDLGKTLEQIDGMKLDLANPLVKAVDAYTKGQSLTQLLLDLGPASGHQVYTAARKERRTKDEIAEAYARGQWDDELKGELGRWLDEKLYERLDDQRLVELHEILLGLAPAVRELKAKRHLK